MHYLDYAKREIGIREVSGKGDNKKILEYAQESGIGWYQHDSVPWCAVFINSMLHRAGLPGTNSASARSFLAWGIECSPKPGAIVVFWRGSRKGWMGHVAVVLKVERNHVIVVGGNQGDAVSIARYPKSKVLGYREWKGYVPKPKKDSVEVHTITKVWLTRGSQGEKVEEMQRMLLKMYTARYINNDVGPIDGDWGPNTTRALLEFKKKVGLTNRPVVGPKTWALLNDTITELG